MLRSIGTLALVTTLSFGCGGAKGDADVPSTEIESADGTPSGGGMAMAASERSGGMVLQYLPASCPAGRFYVDTGALLSDESAQTVLRQLTDAVLDEERDDPEARKVIDTVKRSGFDLATGIKEAAMCVGKRDSQHVMAARFAMDDPIGVLNDIALALGEEDLPVQEKGGAKILVHEEFAFVQPAPGILVIGELPRASQALDREGAQGFGPAAGLVGWLDVPVDDARMTVQLDLQGSQLVLSGTMRMTGQAADAIAQHPHEMSVEMKNKVLQEASQLQDGPFRIVYKRLQDVEIDASGDTLSAKLSFPKDDVTVLLKGAAPMLGVDLEGGGRIAGGSEVDTVDEILEIIRKKK